MLDNRVYNLLSYHHYYEINLSEKRMRLPILLGLVYAKVCERHQCKTDLRRIFDTHCNFVDLFNFYRNIWVHPAIEVRFGKNGRGLFVTEDILPSAYLVIVKPNDQITARTALDYTHVESKSTDTIISDSELITIYLGLG